MELILEKPSFSALAADLIVFGVFQDESLSDALKNCDAEFPAEFLAEIEELCKQENYKAKSKETLSIFTQKKITARRLILVGLGKKNDFGPNAVRKASATFARQFASKTAYTHVALGLRFDGKKELIQAAVEGWFLGSYTFTLYKTQNDNGANETGDKTKRLSFLDQQLDDSSFEQACARGRAIAEATCFARDLIAEPACNMTPTKLAQLADSMTCNLLTCEILEADEAARLGMGAFLGVAQGSDQPPKFIAIKYSHPDAKRFFALVGKGITFDSGGLSLKTAAGMETMKYDMSGAAVVMGVVRALLDLQAPVSVLAVVAACENMPSGTATKPGDILVAMNGKTIEVNNTDAEGRLTLADALCYVCQQKPEAIIDVATLTGAVVAALGKAAAGIMGNDEQLMEKIIDSGKAAGERYWPLPLFDEYKETLKSDVADLKNAGARGEAGSSSAGMFLKEFVEGIPWAHLDIAGAGWMDKDKEELNKGGTAFGVRSLSYFILNQIENESASPV
ncbi:MAG: leucyl aminopeptidase [Candidatus Obscuribacterales bacterium]|jgi:leucyl aminopeptidase|nr:leucyl aminopeptidase [Candidatus Obscuribacterales bacterium]